MMKDKCVSCNKETLYDKTDHIDTRLCYVEGAGQLCLDCYEKIYMKSKKKAGFKINESEIRISSKRTYIRRETADRRRSSNEETD